MYHKKIPGKFQLTKSCQNQTKKIQCRVLISRLDILVEFSKMHDFDFYSPMNNKIDIFTQVLNQSIKVILKLLSTVNQDIYFCCILFKFQILHVYSIKSQMGNQQSAQNGITNTIEALKLKQSKLNQEQVTSCSRKQSKIQQIIEKQDPFIDHFADIEDIKYKKYRSGAVYIGGLDQNERHLGYGKLVHQDGSVQVGNFLYGRLNGKGKSYLTDGSNFQGDFQNGQISGQGTYKIGQYIYKGQFQEGTFSGQGVEKDESKKYFFSGVFQEGRRKRGKFEWTNSQGAQFCYEGQFNAANQFDGYGQLKNAKGLYTGQFKNGKKHGIGKFKFSNGVLYVGDYKNGIRQGNGTVYNVLKSKEVMQEKMQNISYQGIFANNLPHGIGSVYSSAQNKLKIALYQQGSAIRQANQQQKSYYNSYISQIANSLIIDKEAQRYKNQYKANSKVVSDSRQNTKRIKDQE